MAKKKAAKKAVKEKSKITDAELLKCLKACDKHLPDEHQAMAAAAGSDAHVMSVAIPWPLVFMLLKQFGLPIVFESLGKLRTKIEASKMPRFLKLMVLAAIDALMANPDLFNSRAGIR